MSLGTNTAQTRELTELRDHLKWLDEERRKSSRKMAELEQRLAQQGRDLADRDQKIKDLEWHVANFSERFERIPDLDTNVAGTEQRLQDLEWHLSNMNAQLTRIPNMEDERSRLHEEIARAVNASLEQVESDRSVLENRLRSEIVSVRENDEYRNQAVRLEERLEEQVQTIGEMSRQYAALQESVSILSAQLRERTNTLAAESQMNLSSLAAGLQEHLDAITIENQSQLYAIKAETQAQLDAINTDNQTQLGTFKAETLSQLDIMAAETQSQLDLIAAENRTQLENVKAQWQSLLEEKLAARTDEPSPRLLQLDDQVDELRQAQYEWGLKWARFEEQATLLARRYEELDSRVAPLNDRQSELEERLASQLDPSPQLAQIDEQISDIRQTQQAWQAQWAQFEEQTTLLARQYEELDSQIAPLNERQSVLEENLSKLAHVGSIMPLLDRLEQELELRQAEEVRLSNLIGTQENRFAPLASSLEELSESTRTLLSRVSDSERSIEELRTGVQEFNDNWKPSFIELDRRVKPLTERMSLLSNSILKAEAGIQALTGEHSELREIVVNLDDDVHRNQSEVGRRLEGWQITLDENKDTIERFTQQWITLSNQYKEARMAVQNFAHWQKQLEQQKREASEMLRIESNRMQTRWDGFLIEIQEKLKNFELDLNQKWQAFEMENEQKWSSARRSEQLRHEELASIDELIQKLQQDNRNLIWRVQTAQADAIKKWPRLLMEEVEKAVEINPNRRLTTPTSPRADMSVVDAIEQGLITIDYNDDPGLDL
ncbi:MAG: hypothetical protein KIS95_02595 [Anaerolineae bacterium]|uniref:hypothetical protein n=1 Tax=Promineifilum sp. TaxID=2664178 RepID=UPI001D903920|nr:hypothetical protein [Anaerolineales bacterium]MCO5180252.1 hypothetical protein [Promineifilum sp.]MCW5846092.1 hypothetical protein [Anaerolineae bacterium]